LELTREVARRVNSKFPNLFVVPDAYIGKMGARVMGLDDPSVKMSKTASSDSNYISLADTPDQIRNKFKRAVTDSDTAVRYDEDKKPAVSNLLTIYSAFSGQPVDAIEKDFTGKGYGDFKKALGELVVEKLQPLQKRIADLLKEKQELDAILAEGAQKARDLAAPRMKEIRRRLGLGR